MAIKNQNYCSEAEKKIRNQVIKKDRKIKKLKIRIDKLLEYIVNLETTYISEELVENTEIAARVFILFN